MVFGVSNVLKDSELAASASFVISPFYGFPHFDVTTTGGAVKLKTEKIKDLSVDYAKKELPLLNCRKTGRNKNSLILIAFKDSFVKTRFESS